MDVRYLNSGEVGLELDRLMLEYDEFHWSVAWGTDIPQATKLAKFRGKIRRVVFGLSFGLTHPKMLNRLVGISGAKVVKPNGSGIFHPKVYLFLKPGGAAAIVGSANFTHGGTGRNREGALLIEGESSSSPFAAIKAEVKNHWDAASKLNAGVLKAYLLEREHWERQRAKRTADFDQLEKAVVGATTSLLELSWREFAETINEAPGGAVDQRIMVLRRAQELLASAAHFAGLTPLERKAIAGTLGSTENLGDGLTAAQWGFFGSMFANGSFKRLINTNSPQLSLALDAIPSLGEVREEHYLQFLVHFRAAFAQAERKGRVPVASRLLAMKRPDVFVCVDKKNRRKLGANLGFAPTTLDLDTYWPRVIAPLSLAVWNNSPPPKSGSTFVWQYRVAMLDALYYEGP